MEHCPNCGCELQIIAAILQAQVIDRILTHLGLQARAPPRAPARGDLQRTACWRPGAPGWREGLRLAWVEPAEGLRSARVCPLSRRFQPRRRACDCQGGRNRGGLARAGACRAVAPRQAARPRQWPTCKSLRPVRSLPRSSHRGRDANATGTPDLPSTGLRSRSNTDVPGM